MRKIYSLFALLICLSQFILSQDHVETIRNTLLDNNSNKILVVSHRADWRNAPENSLQGIQNCIDMGVDMVEIDLKKTKDGHLIIMHNNITSFKVGTWCRVLQPTPFFSRISFMSASV